MNENKHLIQQYIKTYADNFMKLHMYAVMCNELCQIKEELKIELHNYPELNAAVDYEFEIWCKTHVRLFLKKKINKIDYGSNDNWYGKFTNSYCLQLIDEHVKKTIQQKYKKTQLIKFLKFEESEFKSHITGCDKYKMFVCEHIVNFVNSYVDENFVNCVLNKDNYSQYVINILKSKLENTPYHTISQIVNTLLKGQHSQFKNKTLDERVKIVVKKCNILSIRNNDVKECISYHLF